MPKEKATSENKAIPGPWEALKLYGEQVLMHGTMEIQIVDGKPKNLLNVKPNRSFDKPDSLGIHW